MQDEEEIPIDPQQRDAVIHEGVQLLLRVSRALMNSAAHELTLTPPQASSIVMSILATNVMLYVRGYPRESWPFAFRDLAAYFNRLADEEEATKGEADGGSSIDG